MTEYQYQEIVATLRTLAIILICCGLAYLLLLMLGVVRPAYSQQDRPTSITKVGSTCPPGYVPSALLCNPDRGAGIARVRGLGPCPVGWLTAGDYCLATSGARRP